MSFWDGIFGAGAAQNIFGSSNSVSPGQSMLNQMSSNSGYGMQNSYNNQAMNQSLQQQYARAQQQIIPMWMIDGKTMTIEEFANEVYGDDTPEKTMFLLKYTKETK